MFHSATRRLVTAFAAAVLFAPPILAQGAGDIDRQAMYSRYVEFAQSLRGSSVDAHWMADGSSFWYAEGAPANTVIWKIDPTRNTKAPLFDVGRLRRALAAALGYEPPSKGLPFSEFGFLDGETAVKFRVENKEFVLALGDYAITQSPGGPRVANVGTVSPDGRWFARVQASTSSSFGSGGMLGDVWLRSVDGENVQMTADAVDGYGWTLGLPAIRSKWSPDSRRLALRKMDLRGTPMVSLLHYLEQPERATLVYYPKAGERRALSELYILDVTSKRQMRIHAAEEPGPTPLMWRLDGSELLFLNVARYNVSLDLMAADPTTGSTRRVLTESDPWPYPVPAARTNGHAVGRWPQVHLDVSTRWVESSLSVRSRRDADQAPDARCLSGGPRDRRGRTGRLDLLHGSE